MTFDIEKMEDIQRLSKRFLVLSDFRSIYPLHYNRCQGSKRSFIRHLKNTSDVTKSDALEFATKLTMEELFTEHCFLASKIAKDGYMLEILKIIERSQAK